MEPVSHIHYTFVKCFPEKSVANTWNYLFQHQTQAIFLSGYNFDETQFQLKDRQFDSTHLD